MDISIIIAAYNAEKYIEESIESALIQTAKAKEVIIVDDGSVDATFSIMKKYSENNCVRVYRLPINRGSAFAYNYGFQHSTGKYVMFLDSDDVLDSEYCEKVISSMELTNSSIGFANLYVLEGTIKTNNTLYGERRDPRFTFIFGGERFEYVENDMRNLMISDNHISPRSVYKRELFLEIGLEDTRLKIAHDWLRNLLFVLNNAKVTFEPEPLGYYRVHSEGNSQKNPLKNIVEKIRVVHILLTEYRYLLIEKEGDVLREREKLLTSKLLFHLAEASLSLDQVTRILQSIKKLC